MARDLTKKPTPKPTPEATPAAETPATATETNGPAAAAPAADPLATLVAGIAVDVSLRDQYAKQDFRDPRRVVSTPKELAELYIDLSGNPEVLINEQRERIASLQAGKKSALVAANDTLTTDKEAKVRIEGEKSQALKTVTPELVTQKIISADASGETKLKIEALHEQVRAVVMTGVERAKAKAGLTMEEAALLEQSIENVVNDILPIIVEPGALEAAYNDSSDYSDDEASKSIEERFNAIVTKHMTEGFKAVFNAGDQARTEEVQELKAKREALPQQGMARKKRELDAQIAALPALQAERHKMRTEKTMQQIQNALFDSFIDSTDELKGLYPTIAALRTEVEQAEIAKIENIYKQPIADAAAKVEASERVLDTAKVEYVSAMAIPEIPAFTTEDKEKLLTATGAQLDPIWNERRAAAVEAEASKANPLADMLSQFGDQFAAQMATVAKAMKSDAEVPTQQFTASFGSLAGAVKQTFANTAVDADVVVARFGKQADAVSFAAKRVNPQAQQFLQDLANAA